MYLSINVLDNGVKEGVFLVNLKVDIKSVPFSNHHSLIITKILWNKKKYLELNDKDNIKPWNTVKVVSGQRFIVLNAYIGR